MKCGCYIVGKGGRSFGFDINYGGYNQWRRHLTMLAHSVEPEAVWEHPRSFHGKPFVELIDFVDGCGFVIGAKTSAKLHADLVEFASKAKSYYQSPLLQLCTQGTKRPKTRRKQSVNKASLSVAEELAASLGGSVTDETENEDLAWM